jgi:hypothetical protein
MDETRLPPLPDEIGALLEAEQARERPPVEVTDRIYGRVAAALGWPLLPGGSGGSPTGAPPLADGPGAAGAGGVRGVTASPVVIAAFLVGVAAGVGVNELVHRWAAPPARPEPVAGGREPASPPSRTLPVGQASPAAIAPAPALAALPAKIIRRTVRIDRGTPQGRDEALAAERALVERARSALARSRPRDALAALDEHRKLFAAGQLAEERDALAVIAVAGLGEHEKARSAAERFRKQHPKSWLLPAVEAAVGDRPAQVGDGERPRGLP